MSCLAHAYLPCTCMSILYHAEQKQRNYMQQPGDDRPRFHMHYCTAKKVIWSIVKYPVYVFLQVLPDVLATFRPDIVLYDAGVDVHEDDRLGRLAVKDQGVTNHSISMLLPPKLSNTDSSRCYCYTNNLIRTI